MSSYAQELLSHNSQHPRSRPRGQAQGPKRSGAPERAVSSTHSPPEVTRSVNDKIILLSLSGRRARLAYVTPDSSAFGLVFGVVWGCRVCVIAGTCDVRCRSPVRRTTVR